MRILHLVSYHLFSGPIPPTHGLAVAQRALGHTAWVAFDRKRGHLPDAFEASAAPCMRPSALTPPVALTLSTQSSPWEYISDIRRLRAFMAAAAVDVLHVHQSHDHGFVPWLGRLACPSVRTVHAPRALAKRWGQRWMLNQVDGIIVRCQAHRDKLVARHAPRAQVVVLPGSIDGARFAQATPERGAAARAAWGIPQGAPLVGMVALLADRGQAELLQAVAQSSHGDLHVLLVGRGHAEDSLRTLAQRLGIAARVHWAGYLSGNALVDAYAACDAMFLAQAGNDAGARAALEAMAAGVPLLAVAADAIAELVTQTHGLLAPTRAPVDILDLLGHWRSDPQRAIQRARRAQRYVLQHRHFAREAQATLNFYAHLRAAP